MKEKAPDGRTLIFSRMAFVLAITVLANGSRAYADQCEAAQLWHIKEECRTLGEKFRDEKYSEARLSRISVSVQWHYNQKDGICYGYFTSCKADRMPAYDCVYSLYDLQEQSHGLAVAGQGPNGEFPDQEVMRLINSKMKNRLKAADRDADAAPIRCTASRRI